MLTKKTEQRKIANVQNVFQETRDIKSYLTARLQRKLTRLVLTE